MSDYRVGDRVVLLINNTNGGQTYGLANQEAVICETPRTYISVGLRRIKLINPNFDQCHGECYVLECNIRPDGPRIRKLSGFGSFVKRLDSEDRVQP